WPNAVIRNSSLGGIRLLVGFASPEDVFDANVDSVTIGVSGSSTTFDFELMGTPCDDGDACTTNDECSGGACAGGPPLDCDDLNACTDDSCSSATGCVNTSN